MPSRSSALRVLGAVAFTLVLSALAASTGIGFLWLFGQFVRLALRITA